MRRIISLLLCLIFTAGFSLNVYAETGYDILNSGAERFEDERNDVRLAVDTAHNEYRIYLGDSSEDIDYDLMYRCHSFYNSNFVEAYRNNGNFASNINSSYYWIVPSYDNGGEVDVVPNSDSEFGWSVRTGRELHPYEKLSKKNLEEVYDTILKEYPDADTASFHNLYSEYINCKMVYFMSEGEEYLYIFFLSDKDPDWAESGEIYTAESFVMLASSEFDNNVEDTGVVSFIQENLDTLILASGIILVLVIGLGVFAIKKRNKKDKEE